MDENFFFWWTVAAARRGERLICIFMAESAELLLLTIGLENTFVRPGLKGCWETIASGDHAEKTNLSPSDGGKMRKTYETKTCELVWMRAAGEYPFATRPNVCVCSAPRQQTKHAFFLKGEEVCRVWLNNDKKKIFIFLNVRHQIQCFNLHFGDLTVMM